MLQHKCCLKWHCNVIVMSLMRMNTKCDNRCSEIIFPITSHPSRQFTINILFGYAHSHNSSLHSAQWITIIHRFNSVKNINFFWDNKKIFLTYWKTVFLVTEHFCIKWTFWKNVIFCPKNAFFWQKWSFDPRRSAA